MSPYVYEVNAAMAERTNMENMEIDDILNALGASLYQQMDNPARPLDNIDSDDLAANFYPQPQYYTPELQEYEAQQKAEWVEYCKLKGIPAYEDDV